jgi:hypothetical protein
MPFEKQLGWSESKHALHKALIYYTQRLNPKRATQVVFNIKRSFSKARLDVVSPTERFGDLLEENHGHPLAPHWRNGVGSSKGDLIQRNRLNPARL